MKTLRQVLAEDIKPKENQLHQILLYPDEAQRQLEIFHNNTSDNFKKANPHLLKSKNNFKEINDHAMVVEFPHKHSPEKVKASLDYLHKAKQTLDAYHDYHRPDETIPVDWDNERTLINKLKPLHDDNDPEKGGEFDAIKTYKGLIGRAQRHAGVNTGNVIDKGVEYVAKGSGENLDKPSKVKVDAASSVRSKADKYLSAQDSKMQNKPKSTLVTKKASIPDTDAGEEMDKIHVAWFKQDNPHLTHLPAEKAYEHYRNHMVKGALGFKSKILNAKLFNIDTGNTKKKRSLGDVLRGKSYSDSSDTISHSKIDDQGLHHFQELPKEKFIKHW